MDFSTTIAAPATATGGAISLIRVSGSDAKRIVEQRFSAPLADRTSIFGYIKAEDGTVVDEVLATYFAAPRSYTGEDCVEISCHGSTWITGEIMRLLCSAGACAASAGEFSKRAFLNGKMDLSQAEAVADLIASDSQTAARLAMQQMRGGYKAELQLLRDKLLNITSLLTLELDFSEEDVQFADRVELSRLLAEIIGRCNELCASFAMGNVLKNGVSVAIVGAPNVGKSTLLNALVGEERSIVSGIAGTTRDYIEHSFTISGVRFRFIDTAGLRTSSEASDDIENEGIRRSVQQAQNANIVLYLVDGQYIESIDYSNALIVHSKCDTYVERGYGMSENSGELYISAHTGQGMSELKSTLLKLSDVHAADSAALTVTNARHYQALLDAGASFGAALDAMRQNSAPDMVCALLSDGLNHLAEITGEITTPEILATIFSRFCIGK